MDAPIIVVSGLPRSGTSLMMQMLEAGGFTLLVDHLRAPDESNPRGYFEYAPVKRIQRDTSFLEGAGGKAVKIVSPLLPSLPDRYAYRILVVERAIEEVLLSQRRMLERLGQAPRGESAAGEAGLGAALADAHARAVGWAREQSRATVHRVDHAELASAPSRVAAGVLDFLLGPEHSAARSERVGAMARVFDATLDRERAGRA